MAGGIYNSAAYLFYSILFIYYAYRLNLASFDQAMDWSREGCEAGRISLILMLMLHRQNLEVMHLYIYIYIPKHSAVGGKAVSSKSGGPNVSDIFK
jgi:hypothetical protein